MPSFEAKEAPDLDVRPLVIFRPQISQINGPFPDLFRIRIQFILLRILSITIWLQSIIIDVREMVSRKSKNEPMTGSSPVSRVVSSDVRDDGPGTVRAVGDDNF